MDYFNISLKGKKKLVRWLNEQRKLKRRVCASKMIESAQNEHKLMQMMNYIDKWHDEHPVKQDDPETSQDDSNESTPETFRTIELEASKPEQKELSKRTKGRLNEFIPHHPDVCISELVSNAANEADLLRAIDEIDNRKIPIDPILKMWTVRTL